MEIAKTQSFDLNSIRVPKMRSDLVTRITALDVGQGFEVSGVERDHFAAIVSKLNREGRKIVTSRLAMNTYRIVRVA